MVPKRCRFIFEVVEGILVRDILIWPYSIKTGYRIREGLEIEKIKGIPE